MSTYKDWRVPVRKLGEETARATPEQKRLASFAGIKLSPQLPRVVAAARLKTALQELLNLPKPHASTESQLEFLTELDANRAQDVQVRENFEEAHAWIDFHILKRRLQHLKRLQIEAGDIVLVDALDGEHPEEVVSISDDGRINFRGGHGAGAWPDKVTLQYRKNANSVKARALKKCAANRAATRSTNHEWSLAKQRELTQFEIRQSLTADDVEKLQEVIDSADDETRIQAFLEARPQIIAALLTGNIRFVIPRPQLGGKHVPDFLIADVDSLGIRWLLVELETPTSTVTQKSANVLEKRARKGVSQITEWREWIQKNYDLARRSRREGGLGLFDIRPQSEGLVLIGRRAYLFENSEFVRHPIREDSNIRVHTYDWLLERLDGVLRFRGPSALNPHLIQPLPGAPCLASLARHGDWASLHERLTRARLEV